MSCVNAVSSNGPPCIDLTFLEKDAKKMLTLTAGYRISTGLDRVIIENGVASKGERLRWRSSIGRAADL